MRRTVLLVLGLGLLAGAAAKDEAKDELKKLEGTYVMVDGVKDGRALTHKMMKKASLVIKGNHHTVHVGKETFVGTHKLDPTKKPKAIDATDTEGPFKDQTTHGIYELKGNRFRVGFAEPGKERPKDFKSASFWHMWERQRTSDRSPPGAKK